MRQCDRDNAAAAKKNTVCAVVHVIIINIKILCIARQDGYKDTLKRYIGRQGVQKLNVDLLDVEIGRQECVVCSHNINR